MYTDIVKGGGDESVSPPHYPEVVTPTSYCVAPHAFQSSPFSYPPPPPPPPPFASATSFGSCPDPPTFTETPLQSSTDPYQGDGSETPSPHY